MASYLDGELSLEKRALFDAHLDMCDECSRELGEMRETIRLLRNLPSPEPPPDLVSNVMERIAEGEGQPSWFERLSNRLHPLFASSFAIPATAAAAALALTVVSGGLDVGGFDQRASAPVAEFASLGSEPRSTVIRERRAPAMVRVAQSPPRVQPAPAAQPVPVGNPAPPVRHGSPSGAGSFLYRVANDQVGPMRREPSRLDTPGRVFLMSDRSHVGPYLGASAAPSIALGTGSLRASGSGSLEMAAAPRIHLVSVSRLDAVPAVGEDALTPTERRNRELDMRLEALIKDPPGFAQMQSRVTLAEQELWLRELAARAEELGDVERVQAALEGSGDAESLRLAADFTNAVAHNRAAWAAADGARH
jgi:hypothetical protein